MFTYIPQKFRKAVLDVGRERNSVVDACHAYAMAIKSDPQTWKKGLKPLEPFSEVVWIIQKVDRPCLPPVGRNLISKFHPFRHQIQQVQRKIHSETPTQKVHPFQQNKTKPPSCGGRKLQS